MENLISQKKYLFIDRDGTLIAEPADEQIDSLEKFKLLPHVISSLKQLQAANYYFVMVSNQDGLGTPSFPQNTFEPPQNLLLNILESEGIHFEAIRICPHFPEDKCGCRKPQLGLVLDFLQEQKIDREKSFVIGDRQTDFELAKNMGIKAILLGKDPTPSWLEIKNLILAAPRQSHYRRTTKETDITVEINLDALEPIHIETGIGFFDHMLMQLAHHGGFSLRLTAQGDLHIDPHHTLEDCALALGSALRQALHDKYGIARYGFVLPMDESLAQVAIDLSGRPYCQFNAIFTQSNVGGLPTELVSHFFQSLSQSLQAACHLTVTGENHHHMIEALFKAFGRALRQAIQKTNDILPTTKGVL